MKAAIALYLLTVALGCALIIAYDCWAPPEALCKHYTCKTYCPF